MKKSEFGKGFLVCLVKFMEHFGNEMAGKINNHNFFLSLPKEELDKVLSDNPPANRNYGQSNSDFKWWINHIVPIYGNVKDALSSEIVSWANGASDHLYEIKTPKGKEWGEIRILIKELQDKGLDMGHGNGLMGKKKYNHEDMWELYELSKKIILLIDKKLGLNPDWGEW